MDFEEFTNTYFGGNTDAAFAQLAKESYNRDYTYTRTHTELKTILDSMSSETASRYMKFYGKEIEKDPTYFKKSLDIAFDCATLRMEIDEIEKTDKNPFPKKIMINLIICFSEILLYFIIMMILEKFNLFSLFSKYGIYIISLLLFHGAFEFIMSMMNLRKHFIFRKVKKHLKIYSKNPK